ncbi:acetoacetate decarboxylase family protein [Nocardia sp. NBC_00508]|uniref:acetoacetate decarboxylase family protein n=1 Tax=Nocardia sp. NBC_00508 TaxID=2975992 RepID=UPI002E8237DF|nr:acetoacetate decarboxylase family protein [Nocardia sp. NBC_00508]WUD64998.1 acetoacetate decarboxylase family protein [Nocardia sp. NBC_00508]
MSTHTVLGREVRMPVRIRLAHAFMATYLVPAAAAQRLIDYSGLRVLRLPGGRAMCTLVFVDYVDGDLGPYNEFGVSFMVRHHTASAAAGGPKDLVTGRSGVLIHRLPVDGDFTLAAGRGIWGFPKELAEFVVDHGGRTRSGALHQNGQLIADLTVRPGFVTPAGRAPASSLDAYSHIDGITRCTRWQMRPSGMRARFGGAKLTLGDHPIAEELRSIGLPRRALMSSAVPRLAMTFEDAVAI